MVRLPATRIQLEVTTFPALDCSRSSSSCNALPHEESFFRVHALSKASKTLHAPCLDSSQNEFANLGCDKSKQTIAQPLRPPLNFENI
jgi:hypothetical protein